MPNETEKPTVAAVEAIEDASGNWTVDEVFRAPIMRMIYDEQQKDEEVQNLMKQVVDVTKMPEKMPAAVFLKQNGMLMRKDAKYGMQTVVPRAMVEKILFLEHDTVLKGHPGISAMKIAVRRKYWWKGLDADVEDYVASCVGCQLSKAKASQRFASRAHRRVSNIFTMFSMDLIDMTTISKVYRYVLVLQDYYSSFIVLTNLRNKKTSTVVNAFWDTMSIFGPPQALLTDNGAEFVSALMKDLTESEGIRHVLTYAYHAEGNAKNERTHMSIRQALRIFADQNPETWHRYTKKLQYALNTRETPPLEISPYERLFAVAPRPLHNTTPFLEFDHEQMKQSRRAIRTALTEFQKQQQAAAAKPPPPSLSPGDRVLLVQPFPLKSKALHPAQGPYTVQEVIGETGAVVKHDATQRVRRVPRKWIRLFITRKGDRVRADNRQKEEDEIIAAREKEADAEDLEAAQKKRERELNDDNEESSNKKQKTDRETTAVKRDREPASVIEREPKKRKKSRAIERLQAFNQIPETKIRVTDATRGNMVIVKQGETVRVGEIVEESNDTWTVQWYGTTTTKDRPRRQWKWYPGWEKDDGEIVYERAQNGPGKPALCEIPKAEVIVAFKKLSVHSALPSEVIRATNTYTLG